MPRTILRAARVVANLYRKMHELRVVILSPTHTVLGCSRLFFTKRMHRKVLILLKLHFSRQDLKSLGS